MHWYFTENAPKNEFILQKQDIQMKILKQFELKIAQDFCLHFNVVNFTLCDGIILYPLCEVCNIQP